MLLWISSKKMETAIGVEPTPSTSSASPVASPARPTAGSLPLNGGAVASGAEGGGTLTRKGRKSTKSPVETPSPGGPAPGEPTLKGGGPTLPFHNFLKEL